MTQLDNTAAPTVTDGGSPCGPADRVFELDARFETGGTWAGVSDLIEAAYLGLLEIGETATITRYDYELYMALPQYRDRIRPRYLCLTDTATGIERTRFYPIERSYRVVHGLVGLVLHWKRALGDQQRWCVIVRNFDHAQHLAVRFFGELARRATPDSGIDIITQTDGDASTVASRLPGMRVMHGATTSALIDVATADALAKAISFGGDTAVEINFPRLLQYHRNCGDRFTAAQLAFKVLAVYNRRGYYLGSRSRRTRVESAGQISGLQKTDSRRVSRPWQGSPPSRPPPSVA